MKIGTAELPRPEPPAFPVLASGELVWIALGPFGVLPSSYADADGAKAGADSAYERLASLVALKETGLIRALAEAQAERESPIAGTEWIAVEVSCPGHRPYDDQSFFVAFDPATYIPFSKAYLSPEELEEVLAEQTPGVTPGQSRR